MKKEELKSKPSEQLETELKTIKVITGFLIGALTVLFAVTIYGLITKEDNTTFIASIAVAISCSAILLLLFSSMKKIKTELKLRESTK